MLMNLAPVTAAAPAAPAQQSVVTTAPIVERVTVTQIPSESRGFLATPMERWSWQDLRDYVVHSIEKRHGTFPRDAKKESGIFSRFHREYGADAGRIAQYAFEVCDGWWKNSPVSVSRFTKGSDPYFAAPILERLSA